MFPPAATDRSPDARTAPLCGGVPIGATGPAPLGVAATWLPVTTVPMLPPAATERCPDAVVDGSLAACVDWFPKSVYTEMPRPANATIVPAMPATWPAVSRSAVIATTSSPAVTAAPTTTPNQAHALVRPVMPPSSPGDYAPVVEHRDSFNRRTAQLRRSDIRGGEKARSLSAGGWLECYVVVPTAAVLHEARLKKPVRSQSAGHP